MKAFRVIVTDRPDILSPVLRGQTNHDSIQKMEAAGDAAGARAALARAAEANPNNVTALTATPNFSSAMATPAARDAYEKLLAAAPQFRR